jgi:hypothetical protein
MNAAALIETLLREGATVRIEGSDLVVKGPASVLTRETVSTLKEHKSEVVAYLVSEDGPSHVMHLGDCPALHGGRCDCDRTILVSRRQATEWGWSV